MHNFTNKAALITGAGSGFGAEIAAQFVTAGGRVCIFDRDEAAARRSSERFGDRAIHCVGDVTRGDDFAAAVDCTIAAFGGLDLLVNNAGYTHLPKSCSQITDEEIDRVLAVNVKSILVSTRSAVPAFEARGGGVMINICSVAGLRPKASMAAYNASKGAAITLTKSLAHELAPLRIRVCGVNPTLAETGMTASLLGRELTPVSREQFEKTVPLGRMATADDVARAVLFLASEDARMSTGMFIEVDGGRAL